MRHIALGEYAVVIDGGRVAVHGPEDDLCGHAEDALFELLGTTEGGKLLGDARLGPGTAKGRRALEGLAARLGVPYEPAAPQQRAVRGRRLDYDDDHRRIRAINLPRICTRTITEFEGMCASVVFNGIVDDHEIELLTSWMYAKREFLDAWPLCEVKELMDDILRDGKN